MLGAGNPSSLPCLHCHPCSFILLAGRALVVFWAQLCDFIACPPCCMCCFMLCWGRSQQHASNSKLHTRALLYNFPHIPGNSCSLKHFRNHKRGQFCFSKVRPGPQTMWLQSLQLCPYAHILLTRKAQFESDHPSTVVTFTLAGQPRVRLEPLWD